MTDRCFACNNPLTGKARHIAKTADGQRVYVGGNCYARILNRNDRGGLIPRLGGPALYLDDCVCPTRCDCQSPDTEPAGVSNSCPVHNLKPSPVEGYPWQMCPECAEEIEGPITEEKPNEI